MYIGGRDKYITRETNIFSQLVRKALNLKHDFAGWKYTISSYLYLSWKKFAKYYIDFTYIYGNVRSTPSSRELWTSCQYN